MSTASNNASRRASPERPASTVPSTGRGCSMDSLVPFSVDVQFSTDVPQAPCTSDNTVTVVVSGHSVVGGAPLPSCGVASGTTTNSAPPVPSADSNLPVQVIAAGSCAPPPLTSSGSTPAAPAASTPRRSSRAVRPAAKLIDDSSQNLPATPGKNRRAGVCLDLILFVNVPPFSSTTQPHLTEEEVRQEGQEEPTAAVPFNRSHPLDMTRSLREVQPCGKSHRIYATQLQQQRLVCLPPLRRQRPPLQQRLCPSIRSDRNK